MASSFSPFGISSKSVLKDNSEWMTTRPADFYTDDAQTAQLNTDDAETTTLQVGE